MQELRNKSVLIVGLGISGRSAATFLLSRKAKVTGIDQNRELIEKNSEILKLRSEGLQVLHDSANIPLDTFDFVVVSPGIPQTHPIYKAALNDGVDIVGEIELACSYVSQKCIGVTGTNGKTTVTLLIAHVLNQSGIAAKALGNSGIPLTSVLTGSDAIKPNTVIVAELSSYQLETMHTKILDAAVLLNITPDHLDRYKDMDEYARSKVKIANCLKQDGVLFIEERCSKEFSRLTSGLNAYTYGYSPSCTIYTDKEKVKENIEWFLPVQYRGIFSHDVENLLAAYAMCREFGVTPEQFLKGFSTFKKPAHRVEHVKDIHGVAFVDDSKGTNIDAVMRAVESMKGSVILIVGGVDKGAAYTPWIRSFANKVSCICAIGQAAPKIKQDLEREIPVKLFENLEAAVKYAAGVAKKGETVLLSPGCSSFDMFKDYAHRGDEFKRIVQSLH